MSGATATSEPWAKANWRHLEASLASLRRVIAAHVGSGVGDVPAPEDPASIGASMSVAPALARLVELFRLTSFERDTLLLCAGVELESCFGPLCASAHGDATRTWATFGLALAAFEDAHWSALSTSSPLRYWRLVHLDPGQPLTRAALRIDERVLHYLAGIRELDDALAGLARPLPSGDELVPSHVEHVERIAALWSLSGGPSDLPVIQLTGHEVASMHAIAATAGQRVGCVGYLMSLAAIPTEPEALEVLRRTWQRESVLSPFVMVLDCESSGLSNREQGAVVARFIDRWRCPTIVIANDRLKLGRCATHSFHVVKPTADEQRELWLSRLPGGRDSLGATANALVSQFHLSAAQVTGACQVVSGLTDHEAATIRPELVTQAAWDACRNQARPLLGGLAQAIEPASRREQLVLPEDQLELLGEIVAQVRGRSKVHEQWGFAETAGRGLGISALFAGPSGTGKTMAAEILAAELQLDLFRIDLSAVVSKYIGETEKNLRRVFDAAEAGGAVLLFDEADALFGKRSEVKDSHDRHANIEVSYLLQCMETYRGLAILTTNLKDALDVAFLRRLRFVVSFPFPGESEREGIWQRVFPAGAPTRALDMAKLAKLNVTGGGIRNIALSAAFLAASEGVAIEMRHVECAARRELVKFGRPLTAAETRDWS